MTAETLKPFISLPSTTNGFTTPKRNIHGFIIIGLLSTIVLVATLSGFLVWNSTSRVTDLEQKVHTLQRVVDSMQKRLGLNYLDDFDEFEKAYSNNANSDDTNTSEESDGELLVDSYGDVEDYDNDDLEDLDEDDLSLDGSGNYTDDEEDDDDDTDEDGDGRKLYDDLKKFQESRKLRKSRSIASNGIPVYHEPHTMRRNKSDKLGSDEHIQSKSYSTTPSPKEFDVDPSKQYEDGLIHHRGKIIHRNGKYRNHQSRHRKGHRKHPVLRSVLQTGPKHNRAKSQPLMMPSKTFAIHFYLNSTISGSHNYRNENHLNHHGDVYVGYPHKWALDQDVDGFDVNNGIVKIKEEGIYFIYAQVFYHNLKDENGYKIYHNNDKFIQCALTVPPFNENRMKKEKSNTCYTSGVIYLNRDDTIHLRDALSNHDVIFGKSKSFFGLIKLGSSH